MSEEAAPTPDQVRAAAEAVKAALDAHLAAVEHRSGENDPQVQKAYDDLAAAAEDYDDILYSAYEEVTPFGPVEGLVEDDDDEDVEWVEASVTENEGEND